MKQYSLIRVSLCAVVLLVLSSLSNVVGYQSVQSSNQKVISDKVDQKELLFQTIVDIANNKEIQRIILKSQINRQGFFNPDVRFSVSNTAVLTKNQLKQMYVIGLLLSKIISKSRMHSMAEQYRFSNHELQKEISAAIEKDATLNGEIMQLSNSKCDCEHNNTSVISRDFPRFCAFWEVVLTIADDILHRITPWSMPPLLFILMFIGHLFGCPDWA